jgi:hypothetical protein
MNRFTIENKGKFCRYFLEPLLKLNPKCVLKIQPDQIQAKSSYPDGSLFLEATGNIDTDIKDEKELAFIDLSRFIKTLDFVEKDVVSFKLDQNYISYKDSTNHFMMQLYDTKVVNKPRLSFEKINALGFDLDVDLNTNVFFEIIKASAIYPDLNKLYFNFANNNLTIELTDRQKNQSDGFTRTLENVMIPKGEFEFILPLDPLRVILANKIGNLKFRFHKASSLVNLVYETDGIKMSYVIPCLIK